MRCRIEHGDVQALCARLEALCGDALLDAAQDGLQAGLSRAQREAMALCPVRTGALRRSIGSGVRREKNGVTGELKASAPYAVRVEMGAAGQSARPFLYPAFRANRDRIAAQVAGAIARRLKEG